MPTLLLLQLLAQAASEAESALKASSAVLTDGSVEMPAEEAGTANNHAEVVAFLPLWIALLLFAAATAALCLCGYFHISLSVGAICPHIGLSDCRLWVDSLAHIYPALPVAGHVR